MTLIEIRITAPDATVADRIARALIERRLAACVQQLPGVTSTYVWEGQVEDLGMAIRGGGEVGCRLRAFGLARKLDETSVRKQWLTRDLGTWNYVVQETSDISLLQGQLDQTDPTKVGVRFSVANGASLLGTRHSSIARVFAPAGLYWKQVAGTRAATLAFAATWALTMTSSSELTGTTAFTDTGSESATSFSATATSDTIDYMTFVLDGGASDWTAGTADYAEIYGLRLLGWGTAEDTSGAFYGGTILRDLIALVPGLAVGDIETGSDFGIQQIEAAVRRSARQLVDEIAGYYSREWAVWEDGRFDWKTPALDEPQWVALLSDLDELDLEGTVDGIAKTTYVLYTDAAQQRDAEASATSTDQRNPYVKQDGTRDRLLSAGFPMTSASAAQLAAKYASEGGQWPQVRGTITVAADKLVEHARMGAQPAWTIRAGENIAIADLPKTDTLAAGRDGETHFHIVSADVDLKRRRVVLQVEAQTPRMDQLLARLSTATRAVTG